MNDLQCLAICATMIVCAIIIGWRIDEAVMELKSDD